MQVKLHDRSPGVAGLALALLFFALLQHGCALSGTPDKAVPQSFDLNLYFDCSIKWLDAQTRDRLIEELTNGLKNESRLTRVRLVEIGKEKKAGDVFSTDFNLGAPVHCAAQIPRELMGNAEAERQAKEDAQRRCAPDLERRHKQANDEIDKLADLLRRPAAGLTKCTSFADIISRLRSDQPAVGLIVSDFRANCKENIETYAPTPGSRLIAIQCPTSDGKGEAYTKLLKQMLPSAEVFAMHKMAEAMKSLGDENLHQAIPKAETSRMPESQNSKTNRAPGD